MKSALYLAMVSASLFAGPQVYQQLVYEIRNPETTSADFRHALEKIGENLAYEILEELGTKEVAVETLTGAEATHCLVDEIPVLVTILRAGIPLNHGVQKVFPDSEVGFIAMARNEKTLIADVSYVALPEITDKVVIIADTMLATGGSFAGGD